MRSGLDSGQAQVNEASTDEHAMRCPQLLSMLGPVKCSAARMAREGKTSHGAGLLPCSIRDVNVKFPNEHQLLIWLDPHRMSIVVMVVYRSLSSKTVKEVIAMGGGGGNYDARGVGEGVISDDGCIIQNQGIQTVINLQESGEHASCGKPLEKSGFTYDPDIFMESSIYYYNFKWKDYGFANTNFILDIVKVISFALTQGKIAIHCHADPDQIYNNFEETIQLSRLEEKQTFHLDMRHVIRTVHEKGSSVAFATPVALDRIQLKAMNLPMEVGQLLERIHQVFKRRDEKIDVEELYRNFVKVNGRIAFDSKKACPKCYDFTYNPLWLQLKY
uniref:Uncharacterized protein n=1 Tax=Timema genevievae TaxID=629358 RepID=A0A7R9K9J9_TIMGE|nr:unnamed protein product [Timema genevievae]